MRIVHICTDASGGGATHSMVNLHRALLELGHESFVLADITSSNLENLHRFPDFPEIRRARSHASKLLIWNKRTKISNTHFSLDLLGLDISKHPLVLSADVIHLHWTAEFLSSRSLALLAGLRKRIVWTLHDMRPLTGGCHFTAGCDGYQKSCDLCPQLIDDKWKITSSAFISLKEAVAVAKPFFVAPSRWIAECARLSGITSKSPCRTIPYGINNHFFRSGNKEESRAALGLPKDITLILIACNSFLEKRKGGLQALTILEHLSSMPNTRQKVLDGSIRLICCGKDNETFCPHGWKVERLGYLESVGMVNAYRAADLFLFTSLEDNLPNVLLEAMACGLSVAAHAIGGVPDLIGGSDPVGLLLDPQSALVSASKISEILNDKKIQQDMSERACKRVEREFSLKKQAEKYYSLYTEIIVQYAYPPLYLGQAGFDAAFVALESEFSQLIDTLNHSKNNFKQSRIGIAHKKIKKSIQFLKDSFPCVLKSFLRRLSILRFTGML